MCGVWYKRYPVHAGVHHTISNNDRMGNDIPPHFARTDEIRPKKYAKKTAGGVLVGIMLLTQAQPQINMDPQNWCGL